MEGNANSFEMVIVEFANLETPPELNDDLLNQIDMHIKGTHWANSHQCITMLRSIVKFYPQFTCDVMGRYGVAVLDHLNNGRTQVIKNIFKLLQ